MKHLRNFLAGGAMFAFLAAVMAMLLFIGFKFMVFCVEHIHNPWIAFGCVLTAIMFLFGGIVGIKEPPPWPGTGDEDDKAWEREHV